MAVLIAVYGTADMKQIDRARKQLNELERNTKLNAKGFDGSMARMQRGVGGFVDGLERMGPGLVAVGAGVGILAKKAIDAASDLEESQTKVGVVFGESSDEVKEWASTSASAMGLSSQAALEAAGTYGNLFRAIGLTETQSSEFSTTMTELASDLASFNNTSIDDAILALRSGLVGETEPLKRFGINLNDVRLKEEALRMGLIETTKGTLPAAIKTQAAYSLILKDSSLAQGDFSRTSDGLANKQRILQASMDDLAAKVGEELVPAMTDLVDVGIEAAEKYDKFAATGDKVEEWGRKIREVQSGALFLRTSLRALQEGYETLSDAIDDTNYNTDESRTKAYQAAAASGIYERRAKDATKSAGGFSRAAGTLTGDLEDNADAAEDTAKDYDKLTRAMDGTMVKSDQLSGKVRTLSELHLDQQESAIRVRDAELKAAEALKEHGAKSDQYKSAVIDLERAKLRSADASADLAQAEKDLGVTTDELAKKQKFLDWLETLRDRANKADGALARAATSASRFPSGSPGGTRAGVQEFGAGGKVSSPTLAWIGERNHEEYAITTEPAYRSRSLALYESLGKDLGVTNSTTSHVVDLRGAVFGSGVSRDEVQGWILDVLKGKVRTAQAIGSF